MSMEVGEHNSLASFNLGVPVFYTTKSNEWVTIVYCIDRSIDWLIDDGFWCYTHPSISFKL